MPKTGSIHAGIFNTQIEQAVSAHLGSKWTVSEILACTAGAMHPAAVFAGGGYNAFVKEGTNPFSHDQFIQEALGLRHIREHSPVATPDVIDVMHIDGTTLLIMEAIDAKLPETERDWEIMGRGLAQLHKTRRELCGLETHTYLGIFKQDNTQTNDWLEFFAQSRLKDSFKLVEASGLCGAAELKALEAKLERLIERLPQIAGPTQPFSLLHGDPWLANMLFDGEQLYLIDPGVYYGNREIDLSTAALFKPLPDHFFDAYHEVYPIEPGYKEREELWRMNQYLGWMSLAVRWHGRGTDAIAAAFDKYL